MIISSLAAGPMLFFISATLLIHHFSLTTTAEVVMDTCLGSDNYTSNSAYASNLATLLSSLSSHSEFKYGFYNTSTGQQPDTAYAVAMCRGDLTPDDCASCIHNSSTKLLVSCPNKKRAFAWFDLCMVRYSDAPMYGALESNYIMGHWTNSETTNATIFTDSLYPLLTSLQKQASLGDSRRKVAVGSVSIAPLFVTLNAITQCTPDLSEMECFNCIESIARYIQKWCYGKKGSRICAPSCYLRYETFGFYSNISLSAPTLPASTPLLSPTLGPQDSKDPAGKKKNNASRIGIIVLVPSLAFLVLVACICIICRRRNSDKNVKNPDNIMDVESLQIDFARIKEATNDFSESNKLGEGGFGVVYKGKFPDGREIAAKRLSTGSGQGDEEFKNEVRLVAKLQHKNLVRLLGFCLERNEKLLVYEFVHNASLDHYIFDRIKRVELNWERRYNIIRGIVRGLVYLHQDSRLRIIHRDLKAGNILLDAEMNPKISDFGMAKLFALDQTHGATKRIAGTYGYMAPEYAYHGQFSVKSDVFSFGVLVLEIVAGQKNSRVSEGHNIEDLRSYAWKNWREETAINVVDPMLRDCGSVCEMMKCIQIGLLCVQENAVTRPTMASVDLMLNSESTTIPAPAQPAFLMDSTVGDSDESVCIRLVEASVDEDPITELSAR